MKKFLHSFLPALFLLGSVMSGFAQPLSNRQIDSLVLRSMKTFDVPGMAVAVIKDGKVILAKGYGVRSLKTGKKVDVHTLFAIASNSKAFTTASLAMLVDRGKIHWDDKVQKYIPGFQVYSPYVSSDFTIRDLVTHRSGLGLGAGDLMIFPDGGHFTLKQLIHNLRYLPQASPFRSKFAYDNLLYIVAGEVIHRVSGMSWEAFVQKNIFDKLGMSESAPSYDLIKDTSDMAAAHVLVNGKVRQVKRYVQPLTDPAGGIYSNIHDLVKWVMCRLNGGRYGQGLDQRLFSARENREMFSPQTIIPVRNPGLYNTHFRAYGLGWFLQDVKGYKQVYHSGGLRGTVTRICMIPELHLGIIVLTDQESDAAYHAVIDQMKDGYLHVEGTNRIAQYKKLVDRRRHFADSVTRSVWNKVRWQQKQVSQKPDLHLFTGTYRDNWFGRVTISIKNGRLWFASTKSPQLRGPMEWYKGTTFIVKWVPRYFNADAFVLFEPGFQGKMREIKMKPVSPLTDFSYDFQDLDFHRVK